MGCVKGMRAGEVADNGEQSGGRGSVGGGGVVLWFNNGDASCGD